MSESKEITQADQDSLPWQKQPWETWTQYEKFMCYKELPVNDRSYAEAARVYYEDPDRTSSNFSTIAQENNWQKRVEAFDRWTSQLVNQDQSQRHQREKRRTADLVSNVKDAMIEFVDNFWEMPKKERLEKFDEMSMKEFIQMMERIEEIENRVLGEERREEDNLIEIMLNNYEESEEKELVEAENNE